jgi:hypothetical protein
MPPQTLCNVTSFFYYIVIIIVLGVHCDIYKSSYNISQLNSPPPSLSFIPTSPYSWNSFNRTYFSIFIHGYLIFPLYSPSFTFFISSPLPLVPSPRQEQFYFPVLFMKKKRHFCLFKIALQGVTNLCQITATS